MQYADATTAYLPFPDALARALAGAPPEPVWLVPLLACAEEDAPALFAAADGGARRPVGGAVHLRGLIEFSQHLPQRLRLLRPAPGTTRGIERYRLSPEEILAPRNGRRHWGTAAWCCNLARIYGSPPSGWRRSSAPSRRIPTWPSP